MQPGYYDIELQSGISSRGTCLIRIAPKEWLVQNIVPSFGTGAVLEEVQLIAGKSWLEVDLNPESYKYKEEAKSDARGSYVAISVSGTLNNFTDTTLSVLRAIQYHEMIIVCLDKSGKNKVIGNLLKGMRLTWKHDQLSDSQSVDIACTIDIEEIPPFYMPGGVVDAGNTGSSSEYAEVIASELPIYQALQMEGGMIERGLCDLKVAPREWVKTVVTDGDDGSRVTQIQLYEGKHWLAIQFVPRSYKMVETQKVNTSGEYVETVIGGLINHLSPAAQQALHTLRYHELVANCTDRQKRKRIVGNADYGMALSYTLDKPSDTEQVEITFTMEYPTAASYYESKGDLFPSYIQTEGADFLLTEDGLKIQVE